MFDLGSNQLLMKFLLMGQHLLILWWEICAIKSSENGAAYK